MRRRSRSLCRISAERIFLGGRAASAGAGEGAVGDDEGVVGLASDAAEDLGAGGDEDAALALHVDHVGAWVDGADVVFDISTIVPGYWGAVALGRVAQQDAIYDIEHGKEIRL